MSITRINNANAFTGTIPATNFANSTLDNITSLPNAPLGDMVLVSSATASGSASIEFSLGSYKEYKFFFVNIHPQTSNADLMMNFSTDNGSNYNVTKTSTHFRALHNEADTATSLAYDSSNDMAQGTGDLNILLNIGATDADMCGSGYLHLFNPSSTTYVKHFMANLNRYDPAVYTVNQFTAGYANTTSALTNIRFNMDSGNIDDGKILMFGIN